MMLDTNVVIELLDGTGTPEFYDVIARFRATNDLFINEIVFAELSGRHRTWEEVGKVVDYAGLKVARMALSHCHRAGLAFNAYRKNGGSRTTILPDFLIGAHAAGQGWPLVTRDRKGFAAYFPEVELIDPMKVSND